MDCDVAVLGGGPGGYTAAIRAAQLGAKVVCIEQEPELGGTCLRVGCIPTKAWVQTAFLLKEAEESFAKLGIRAGEPRARLPAGERVEGAVVKQMTGGVASLFKANGVEWVEAPAASRTRTRSRSKAGRTSSSSRRSSPPARRRSSRRSRASTPRSASTRPGCSPRARCRAGIAILGGGVIGCEFASIFHRFGSEVTIDRDAAAPDRRWRTRTRRRSSRSSSASAGSRSTSASSARRSRSATGSSPSTSARARRSRPT